MSEVGVAGQAQALSSAPSGVASVAGTGSAGGSGSFGGSGWGSSIGGGGNSSGGGSFKSKERPPWVDHTRKKPLGPPVAKLSHLRPVRTVIGSPGGMVPQGLGQRQGSADGLFTFALESASPLASGGGEGSEAAAWASPLHRQGQPSSSPPCCTPAASPCPTTYGTRSPFVPSSQGAVPSAAAQAAAALKRAAPKVPGRASQQLGFAHGPRAPAVSALAAGCSRGSSVSWALAAAGNEGVCVVRLLQVSGARDGGEPEEEQRMASVCAVCVAQVRGARSATQRLLHRHQLKH